MRYIIVNHLLIRSDTLKRDSAMAGTKWHTLTDMHMHNYTVTYTHR